MEETKQDVDELMKGINEILKENRCSLSVEDELVLTQTISYLKRSKETSEDLDWNFLSKALELILRIFFNSDSNDYF